MKKKVLATLLVGTMAASLLAGCGTTVETTGSSDTTTAPEKTQTTETAEAGEAGGSDVSADITLWTYPIGEWGNAERGKRHHPLHASYYVIALYQLPKQH